MPWSAAGRAVLAKFFRALGDPSRLSLLAFIAEAERTGTECVEFLGLSQSRVSAHLACLVTCGFVASRREGRFVYYAVGDPRVPDLVRLGADLAADNAAAVAACARVDTPHEAGPRPPSGFPGALPRSRPSSQSPGSALD